MKNIIFLTAIFTFSFLANNSFAAQVRVTLLSNVSDSWAGEYSNINMDSNICVYSDIGNYNVTCEGQGVNAGRFRVFRDGINTSPFLNYIVFWNDEPNGGTIGQGAVRLTQQTALTGQTTSETASDDCSGGANPTVTLRVRFGRNHVPTRPAGSYNGTLECVVSHP